MMQSSLCNNELLKYHLWELILCCCYIVVVSTRITSTVQHLMAFDDRSLFNPTSGFSKFPFTESTSDLFIVVYCERKRNIPSACTLKHHWKKKHSEASESLIFPPKHKRMSWKWFVTCHLCFEQVEMRCRLKHRACFGNEMDSFLSK